jgi:hypothetical protein
MRFFLRTTKGFFLNKKRFSGEKRFFFLRLDYECSIWFKEKYIKQQNNNFNKMDYTAGGYCICKKKSSTENWKVWKKEGWTRGGVTLLVIHFSRG